MPNITTDHAITYTNIQAIQFWVAAMKNNNLWQNSCISLFWCVVLYYNGFDMIYTEDKIEPQHTQATSY